VSLSVSHRLSQAHISPSDVCSHCIATISPPDEKYFKDKKPLPHVPSRPGNNLPRGEGCWLCSMTTVERAELIDFVTTLRRQRYRRDIRDVVLDQPDVEHMLTAVVRVNVRPEQTRLSRKEDILTMLPNSNRNVREYFKLFGEHGDKFNLIGKEKQLILRFAHKVTKQRHYKLVLGVLSQTNNLALIPLDISVIP